MPVYYIGYMIGSGTIRSYSLLKCLAKLYTVDVYLEVTPLLVIPNRSGREVIALFPEFDYLVCVYTTNTLITVHCDIFDTFKLRLYTLRHTMVQPYSNLKFILQKIYS